MRADTRLSTWLPCKRAVVQSAVSPQWFRIALTNYLAPSSAMKDSEAGSERHINRRLIDANDDQKRSGDDHRAGSYLCQSLEPSLLV